MKLIFLGVGEAADENYPNNSHLILSKTKLLLDCGSSVPPQVWKYNDDQEFLDAVYISHSHADHYFGIPSLLLRMFEENRKKPLTIICQKEVKEKIKILFDLGYPSTFKNLDFELKFIDAEESKEIKFNELKLEFALTTHGNPCLAVKVSDGKNSVCYIGDGGFNEKTKALAKDSDLIIGEAYQFEKEEEGHSTVKKLLETAEKNNIKCLALTHINRFVRRNEIEKIKEYISKSKIKVIIAEPMEEYPF